MGYFIMDNVEEKVKEVITNVLGLTAPFSNYDNFVDLGADSLDTVELIINVEENFGVELTDLESESCETPHHLIELIKSKLK